ncbi:PadR family transcriptional regulator [Actinoplanes derwentensis]|uniref:DNA-binding transcriptional regulator, PadR family n=1 Tax=Actinoplanes derwentensis TaxID=113562 RepID=A0A1H1WS27_9ACTN|nr:PadR family transcriptional regulator [Actinoplanes derwentensis]GID87026.1 PadR family transcriptional regulator [Actinoplanes derwentensis]SDS98999.1 DNA-binding transcriptional regulator, PadR family [Actinoplanes derwentensis]
MRALDNPLTMAVLALLREGPRHPYEMQHLLRERNVGAVVKLRGGSLYDAIDRLARASLIEPVGRSRSGARPERTVYTVTPLGEEKLTAIVGKHVGAVAEEFPAFTAGLAHILHLEKEAALHLLHERRRSLTALAEETDAVLLDARQAGVPRLPLLETEYTQLLRHTEIAWLHQVTTAIEEGDLPWTAPPSPQQEA